MLPSLTHSLERAGTSLSPLALPWLSLLLHASHLICHRVISLSLTCDIAMSLVFFARSHPPAPLSPTCLAMVAISCSSPPLLSRRPLEARWKALCGSPGPAGSLSPGLGWGERMKKAPGPCTQRSATSLGSACCGLGTTRLAVSRLAECGATWPCQHAPRLASWLLGSVLILARPLYCCQSLNLCTLTGGLPKVSPVRKTDNLWS